MIVYQLFCVCVYCICVYVYVQLCITRACKYVVTLLYSVVIALGQTIQVHKLAAI